MCVARGELRMRRAQIYRSRAELLLRLSRATSDPNQAAKLAVLAAENFARATAYGDRSHDSGRSLGAETLPTGSGAVHRPEDR